MRLCYLAGVKIPLDSLPHLLDGVNRDRVLAWARDVCSALATAEYCESLDFEFGEGILEYDTAKTSVRRNPASQEVSLVIRSEFFGCRVFVSSLVNQIRQNTP